MPGKRRWVHRKLLFSARSRVKDILADGRLEVDGLEGGTKFCNSDNDGRLRYGDIADLVGGKRWATCLLDTSLQCPEAGQQSASSP